MDLYFVLLIFFTVHRLNTIIDVTGASSYHGFLPVMVRSCISTLTATSPPTPNPFPAPLATALFSFLYHLASYEAGGEALVSCGMMESLISVVNWKGTEPDHITVSLPFFCIFYYFLTFLGLISRTNCILFYFVYM